MGTIADKLSYLNDTKTLLRRGINALGGDLTTDDTFRSYANALDNIYDYLPKVTGTGTSVTLDDVRDGGLRITLNPTAISQTTYTGKNLANFPINTLPTANTTIIDFGKDMTFDSITTSFYLNNVQYTNGSGGLVNYQKNDGTNQYILPGLYRNSSNTGMSANTTLNGQYSKTETNITFRKVIVTNYPSFTQGTLNIQVELGSTATSYEPYVGGTASPNPSYPQDIHTISGNNSVVVEGKNISPVNEKLITGTIGVSGTVGSFDGSVLVKDIPVEPNQTYIITMNKPTEISPRMMFYNEKMNATNNNSAYLEIINSNRGVQEIINENGNTNTTYQYMAVLLGNTTNYSQGQQVTINISQLMVRKSNTSTNYEPHVSQIAPINLGEYELGTIGNYSNEFVRSGGENLCSSGNQTFTRYIEVAIEPIQAGTYTLSCYCTSTDTDSSKSAIIFVNSNNNEILTKTLDRGQISTSITLPSTAIKMRFYASDTWLHGEGDTATFSNVMISTTDTPYVPYEKGWYYKEGIGKVVLDGTESGWGQNNSQTQTNTNYFYCPVTDNYVININNSECYSNYFLKTTIWSTDNEGINLIGGANSLRLRVNKTTANDTEGLKTWLSTHNTIVYYLLATPTYTKLTDTTLINQLENTYKNMLSYKGTTNISQVNNDLPFTLSVSAIEDLS